MRLNGEQIETFALVSTDFSPGKDLLLFVYTRQFQKICIVSKLDGWMDGLPSKSAIKS